MGLLRRRVPPFVLTGLAATPEGLFDGSFVVACARWWNHVLESEKQLRGGGYSVLSSDDLRRLAGVPQPENRQVFEGVASRYSFPGRHSTAVLCLSYAFALVVDAARSAVLDEGSEGLTQAPPFTADDLIELEHHYSQEGSAREHQPWPPYWHAIEAVLRDGVGRRVVRSLTGSFDD